jgi:hypothetical protein
MPKVKSITVDGVKYAIATSVEVANFASLPVVGESDTIYVTINNNKIYRWTGSSYVQLNLTEEIDLTGKADLVEGKVPESQLPSGILFPKLIKANANDINFVSYLFDQENEFDIRLPQGFGEDGISEGSFVIFFIPKESVFDDWSMIFTLANFGSGYGTPPLNRQQVALEVTQGLSNFTVGYRFDPEGTSAYFYVHGSGVASNVTNWKEVGSDSFSAFNGILTISSIYRGDFYIAQAM